MTVPIDRRDFLVSIPALLAAHRLIAQGTVPQIRVNGLSQMTLTVSDPKRSIDFYQGLFGMPVQARQGATTILRVGAGPQFLSIRPIEGNASPSITHYGLGVEGFSVDRIMTTLAARSVAKADAVGPMR